MVGTARKRAFAHPTAPRPRHPVPLTLPLTSLPGGVWGFLIFINLFVALVIAFPATVTALLDAPSKVDFDKVRIQVPEMEPLPEVNFDAPPHQALLP